MQQWMANYTEVQLEFLDYKREMESLPWQEREHDYRLSRELYVSIKHQLRDKFPRTAMYTSNEWLLDFSEKLASMVEDYQVAVMSYEALAQVAAEQSYWIRSIIGIIRKDELFALVDKRARIIGVHVPKSKKLKALEQRVEKALVQLDGFITRKGGTPNAFVRVALENFIFEQKHDSNVPEIKIVAVKKPIKGGKEVDIRGFGGLQMSFKVFEEKEVVYYHII